VRGPWGWQSGRSLLKREKWRTPSCFCAAFKSAGYTPQENLATRPELSDQLSDRIDLSISRLPKANDPGNLVHFPHLPHTRLTYHRTWETGLETEIRVADFSPAFFLPHNFLLLNLVLVFLEWGESRQRA
jgi:hypothetical protein